MVTWVLEKDLFEEDAVKRMIEHFKIKNIPFKTLNFFGDSIGDKVPVINDSVVFYGSITSQAAIHKQGWEPGVFKNENFNFKTYHDNLIKEDAILNAEYELCELKDIVEIANKRGWKDVFIRPNLDSKEFAGTVLNIDAASSWLEYLIKSNYLRNDIFDVIIAPPQIILAEYRLVMVNGRMVASSQYRKEGTQFLKEGCLPIIKEMAERLDKTFQPAPIYVVDIAEVNTKWGTLAYKVVEYGTFNSAGMYSCKVSDVIDAVTSYVDNNYQKSMVAA